MSMEYIAFYLSKTVQNIDIISLSWIILYHCESLYGKVIILATAELTYYRHCNTNTLQNTRQCAYIYDKIACHNAYILKIYNRQ